tara:strand:+ start:511 stop:975 length:465 start_codon:yes stop_codon:yes gene_type:complete
VQLICVRQHKEIGGLTNIAQHKDTQLGTVTAPLNTQQLVALAKTALEDKKADNICQLKLPAGAPAEALLIATATSERHAATLAHEVVKAIKAAGETPMGVEGENGADWVLVDYGSLVVHIFMAEARTLYNLEKLWAPVFEDDSPTAPTETSQSA